MPEIVSTVKFVHNKGAIIDGLGEDGVVFVANEKKPRKSFVAVMVKKYIEDTRSLGRETEAQEVEKLVSDIDERISIRYKKIRSQRKSRYTSE